MAIFFFSEAMTVENPSTHRSLREWPHPSEARS